MSDGPPVLFSTPGSGALAVAVALRWAGADHELRVLGPGQARGPAFLAINPAGQVPALTLDDEPVLTETHALLLLVADSHPESRLAPPSTQPMGRYRLEELLAFMTGEVSSAFAPFLTLERVEARALAWNGASLKVPPKGLERLRALLARLDARLGPRDYVLGERTVADAYLYVLARWAADLHHEAALPNLARFRAAMEANPAVAGALADHGL